MAKKAVTLSVKRKPFLSVSLTLSIQVK